MANYKKLTKSGKYTSAKGTFYPLRSEKYSGYENPKFKSKLEQSMMSWCDKNSSVKSWSYERIIIPYKDKTRNNSNHNYIVDFKIMVKTKTGQKTFLVEVKSKKETVKPVPSKRKKPENYRKEVETWVRNQCKWTAATQSAKARGWEFKILTENELG